MDEKLRTWLEFSSLVKNFLNNVDERSYRPFLIQIKEINEDLESSKILYRIKKYRNSIILLSQAVEKITKSNLMFLGVFDSKQAKKISHITPEAYLELFRSEFSQLGFKAVGYQGTTNGTHDEFTKLLKKDKLTVATLSYEEIQNWFVLYEKSSDILTQFFNKIDPYSKREFIKKWALSLLHLYYLSFILYPHYEIGRYQSELKTRVIYDENNSIVRLYPELIEKVVDCVDSISYFAEAAYQRKKDFDTLLSIMI